MNCYMNSFIESPTLLREIKSELLCFGTRVSSKAKSRIHDINPYLNNKCVHGAGFFIGNEHFINIQFNEQYNQSSPYFIRFEAGSLFLEKNDKRICKINVSSPPIWYKNKTSSGLLMHEIFNVHGKNTLALSNYTSCYYATCGKKCKFCSVKPHKVLQTMSPETRITSIIETLRCAFMHNPNYSIALSGGTVSSQDRGSMFFSQIAERIISIYGQKDISAELAPPEKNSSIDQMIECGITSIIMNIEIFDDRIRQIICPGKSEISINHYMKSLSYAANRLGVGNVSSVLIAGIEPEKNTIRCAKELLYNGVIPIIIPFKPYDNCELSKNKVTQPYILKRIYDAIETETLKLKLSNCPTHSCIKCGGCNLQNSFIR